MFKISNFILDSLFDLRLADFVVSTFNVQNWRVFSQISVIINAECYPYKLWAFGLKKGIIMNFAMKSILVAGALALGGQAMAASKILTASIDRDGKVERQDGAWIKSVKLINQKDYFATYEVYFADGYFNKAPSFCAASTTDTRDTDRLYYANVKLGNAATAQKVNVLGMMPGKSGPSGDTSQSFQLMCIR